MKRVLCCLSVLLLLCGCAGQNDTIQPVLKETEMAVFLQLTEAPAETFPAEAGAEVPTAQEATPGTTREPTPRPTQDNSVVSLSSAAYDYAVCQEDIRLLTEAYGDKLTKRSAGKSAFGKDLTVLILGDEGNPNRVLIQGATHAREYATSQVIMRCIEDICKGGSYEGRSYEEIVSRCAIWFLPMLDPDGVDISIHGLASVPAEYRESVRAIGEKSIARGLLSSGSFTRWKANGQGIDLNQNFGAGERTGSRQYMEPMSEAYRGGGTFTAPETQAARELSERCRFRSMVSYHACGRVIYWHFGQTGAVLEESSAMAKALKKMTGYSLVAPDQIPSDSAAWGWKDWFIVAFNRPGFTIEIGSSSAGTPLPAAEVRRAYEQNRQVPLYLAWHEWDNAPARTGSVETSPAEGITP